MAVAAATRRDAEREGLLLAGWVAGLCDELDRHNDALLAGRGSSPTPDVVPGSLDAARALRAARRSAASRNTRANGWRDEQERRERVSAAAADDARRVRQRTAYWAEHLCEDFDTHGGIL